jgi:hypothetical protein
MKFSTVKYHGQTSNFYMNLHFIYKALKYGDSEKL